MYKTVDFNIFEQQLEEIVYGKSSALRRNEHRAATIKSAEYNVTTLGEIVVKPLNETPRSLRRSEEK